MSEPGKRFWSRIRFLVSWTLALALVGIGLPRAVDVSWHGVVPVLKSLHWPALVVLVVIWFLGLFVHSFVLTAAAPSLTHRRALTLNVTGSAVSNVVPLGGAAGVELNRRMMRGWGIESHSFVGYTFLTNLWDVLSKLMLPIIAVAVFARSDETVTGPLKWAFIVGAISFAVVAGVAVMLLGSVRWATFLGRVIQRALHPFFSAVGRQEPDVVHALLETRRECKQLVANGWLRMSLGIMGYVALQCLLLGICLQLTGANVTWVDVLAGFAVERMLTVLPITPGGVGVADLGLVGVLLAFGGDPAGVTAAAVLYRGFVFAAEIPVGGGTLGLWLLGQRLKARNAPLRVRVPGETRRIAHVTDVFLPRLGGIETHVDDLVRHQRAVGLEAEVLTPTPAGDGRDPSWVRRLPAGRARALVADYDVVHVHVSMWSPYGVGVARAAIAAGLPTLITVHSMWAGAGGVIRLAALAGLRRWPVAWSAVSGAAADTFRRSLGDGEVAVLPNAIDVEAWRPPAPALAEATAAAPDPQGPVTLISVMRLMPRKRPVHLVRLFESVRAAVPGADVRLVVVGDGPLRRRMERRIRRSGLGDVVRLTGRLPREDVLQELRAASVYVAPAPKESFGIAALEARCAGLPIVASRASGVGEFVRHQEDGLLVAGDVEMTRALVRLVVDGDLRARITTHNRDVAPPFDWTDVLAQTDDLYAVAAARAGVPAAADDAVVVPLLAEEA
ncbi:glycosyltransferase [Nocardioides jiangxiensis]|uniref:Glycosyltransferase n=1 Tax=Nocardioides jiangxiensis TaxID=3064524 RepID=A0ABT9B3K4_9ACTN|nr:glycosyltransferase [Nocardioides sp. WY-20]MDO7869427.1 glycosyltransferase [Nocardioides sp. WY-20]